MVQPFIAMKLSNGSTEDIKVFGTEDSVKFKELNLKGYNIYQSINSFYDIQRKMENVFRFNGIGIDMDLIPNEDGTYPKDNASIVERIHSICGTYPSKVNETYKGYHLFFDFSDDLAFLSNDTYRNVYNWFNAVLGGDLRMKDITAILKIEGYLDNKEGRNKFTIKNVFDSYGKNVITYEFLKNKGFTIEFKNSSEIDTKLKKIADKDVKKNRNKEDINSIDGMKFIQSINELNASKPNLFKNPIEIKKVGNYYSIDNTNGLKLIMDSDTDKWVIGDFSKQTRSGNLNFFYNHYVSYMEKLPDILEIEDKQKRRDALSRMKGIALRSVLGKSDTGIVPQYGVSRIPVPSNLILKLDKDGLLSGSKIDSQIAPSVPGLEGIIEELNASDDLDKGAILKLFIAMSKFRIWNKLGRNSEMIAGESELMDILGLSYSQSNKKLMRKTLLSMKKVMYMKFDTIQCEDGTVIEINEPKSVFNVKLYVKKDTKQVMYSIKYAFPHNNVTYVPESVLTLDSGMKNAKKALFASVITAKIKEFKNPSIKMEDFIRYIGIKSKDKYQIAKHAKDTLQNFKDSGVIKGFERGSEGNTYYVW